MTDFSMQLSWIPDTEYAQLFLADSNGHYETEGVSLDFIAGGPDIGAIEGIVASGSADMGISTDITTVIAAIADGNPLVVIGTLYQSNLNCFISNPDSPITSVEEMVGKRIGGSQGSQVKFDAMFEIAGLEPDYTYVPTGYGPDAVINGDADVQSVFITDEVLAYIATTGEEPTILTFEDAGLPSYTLPIYVTRTTLEEKRDALKGFLAASLKGFDENEADPVAGATLAAEVYGKDDGLTVEEETAKNERYVPLQSSTNTEANGYMYIDPDYLEGPIYAAMEAAGLKTVPASEATDMSLLDEIRSGS
jgi:ABC-type nitrate/sulfonate/bicarbonate transport system substrate-binding protein